uniref:Uncharacterized protein n=1 Tax=Fagus sylvatica TaxID=28930 RepID=A0A2N9G1W2_FAGSY
MAERGGGGERGGFGRGFGGGRPRGDHRARRASSWIATRRRSGFLVTKLGRLVYADKMKSLEQIYLHSLPIKEHQIHGFGF